jgi:hypothetical protein
VNHRTSQGNIKVSGRLLMFGESWILRIRNPNTEIRNNIKIHSSLELNDVTLPDLPTLHNVKKAHSLLTDSIKIVKLLFILMKNFVMTNVHVHYRSIKG